MAKNIKRASVAPISRSKPVAATVAPPTPAGSWLQLVAPAITAILFLRAIFGGITYLDDYYYITTNPYLRNFSWSGVTAIFTSFYSGNYHPLTTITFWLEFHLFGTNPLPYHLLNVALHVFNTWLVYRLIMKLHGSTFVAFAVALLFGIHPMHVESVAWISERKDVLYSAFYLSAACLYLDYLNRPEKKSNLVFALILFVLSLLSKSAAVTLPLLFLVFDYYKGYRLTAKSVIAKLPFFALSIVFGIVAILSQSAGNAIMAVTENYGAVNRLFFFTTGLATYLVKLVVPFNLAALHFYPSYLVHGLAWYYYASLPFLIGLILLAIKQTKLKKDTLFGLFFFIAAISVMLQIIAVGTALYAERYTYISYIGLFFIGARFLEELRSTKYATTAMTMFYVLAACYVLATYDRIGVWKDSITLFTDAIDKNPENHNNCFIFNIRGNVYKAAHEYDNAMKDYNAALSLNPDLESAYWNRGDALQQLGNFAAAIADFSKSLQMNPKVATTYNDRGWAFFRNNQPDSAIKDFDKAIQLDPKLAEAYNNRGWVWYTVKNNADALEDFAHAIKLNPDFDKPYYNIAMVKATSGDLDAAIVEYTRLLSKHPDADVAYFDRGLAYFNKKDNGHACEDWHRAADLGNANARQMILANCH